MITIFATSHTHFLFNGCFYDQVGGVAMGSPLAPVLANFEHLSASKGCKDKCDISCFKIIDHASTYS